MNCGEPRCNSTDGKEDELIAGEKLRHQMVDFL
jgi:hypothetical protein